MKRSCLLALLVAVMTGCGPTESGDEESFDDSDSDDSDDLEGTDSDQVPDGPCTPETDEVPFDEIAEHISSVPTGDIVRAADGTTYFISFADAQSVEIGRRLACGAIETDWMSITAPINDLEVSADNQLYMAASGSGSAADVTARLYRLDLTSDTAFPQTLVREPGQVIRSLSAHADGRVYFVQGYTTYSVRYADSEGVTTVMSTATQLSNTRAVAAAPDGSLLLSGVHNGAARMGKITFAGTTPTLTTQPADYEVFSLRADAQGGYYGVRATGTGSAKTYSLVHAPSLGGARMIVDELSGVEAARYALDATGDMTTVLRVTPLPNATAYLIEIPTALAEI